MNALQPTTRHALFQHGGINGAGVHGEHPLPAIQGCHQIRGHEQHIRDYKEQHCSDDSEWHGQWSQETFFAPNFDRKNDELDEKPD